VIATALLTSSLATAALRATSASGVAHPAPGVYLFDADGDGKPDRFEVDWSLNGAKQGYNVDLTLVDHAGRVLLEDAFFIAEKDYDALFDLAAGERVPVPRAYFADFLGVASGPNAVEQRELDDEEVAGLSGSCLGDPDPSAALTDRMRLELGRDRHFVLTYSRGTRDDGYTLAFCRALDRLVCLPEGE